MVSTTRVAVILSNETLYLSWVDRLVKPGEVFHYAEVFEKMCALGFQPPAGGRTPRLTLNYQLNQISKMAYGKYEKVNPRKPDGMFRRKFDAKELLEWEITYYENKISALRNELDLVA